MDNLKIRGEVQEITEMVEVKSFKKQELVIKTEGQYPQYISVEFANAKIDLLTPVSVGRNVEVSVNSKGR